MSPKVQAGLLAALRAKGGEPAAAGRLQLLSEREREAFQLLALGRGNKEIARDLKSRRRRSRSTARTCSASSGSTRAVELTRLAVREGLLDA